jgi:hypothetical protein
MGRAKKETKPKGNRGNIVKNMKRIKANEEVLKQLSLKINKSK